MPTAFCSLEDAYGGNWTKPPNVSQNKEKITDKPVVLEQNSNQETSETSGQNTNINTNFDTNNDIRSFCPNCESCKKSNDVLQQKIINQTIWPRPQWIPQVPNAYTQHDPYSRYWTNVNQIDQREDFSNNLFDKNDSTDILLKVVIFMLLILFIVQLVDIIFKNKTP